MANEILSEIVDVVQITNGFWMMTVDGIRLGDSRPQPTREAAIAYARAQVAQWGDCPIVFAFDA